MITTEFTYDKQKLYTYNIKFKILVISHFNKKNLYYFMIPYDYVMFTGLNVRFAISMPRASLLLFNLKMMNNSSQNISYFEHYSRKYISVQIF